ncbi:tetratricopeptide repeat protein [Geotalea sp. SG265]|uniref:tetratricopeptide repeat protein n=1 Tax=Geotalea sp. SG265 TaxID=2922867 RepID=UPI001FAEAF42|nr:tetratricopeptide repeat protein [Geotalea sp. SG265]
MKKIALILFMALSACTTGREGSGILNLDRNSDLAHAVRLYEEGKEQEAEKRLKEVVAQKGVAGVTDEALFRLSLMQLKSGIVREDLEQPLIRLETLQRNYPSSPWARLAAPLVAVIKETQRQNREIRILVRENRELSGLRGQNFSLIKENKELKKTIERLKYLDMELEKKPRRR